MQTKTNQTDPELLDILLRSLLEDEASLPRIATKLRMSLADLLAIIERPEVQEILIRLRTALTQRAELVALTTEAAALRNLASVGADLDEIETERTMIEDEAASLDPAEKNAIAECSRQQKAVENRRKDRIESARAARNALAHARTRTTRAHDHLPQALKLALPLEELEKAG